jgi:hypothetical protein
VKRVTLKGLAGSAFPEFADDNQTILIGGVLFEAL